MPLPQLPTLLPVRSRSCPDFVPPSLFCAVQTYRRVDKIDITRKAESCCGCSRLRARCPSPRSPPGVHEWGAHVIAGLCGGGIGGHVQKREASQRSISLSMHPAHAHSEICTAPLPRKRCSPACSRGAHLGQKRPHANSQNRVDGNAACAAQIKSPERLRRTHRRPRA